MVVVVTGANGQLGQAIQSIADQYPSIDFVFCSSSELDITSTVSCEAAFTKYKPDFCINTAAYTAVDKAESETEKAYLVNVIGPKNLAEICKQNNTVLLHVSTDFVLTVCYLQPKQKAIKKQTRQTLKAYTVKQNLKENKRYKQFGTNILSLGHLGCIHNLALIL